MGVDYLESNRGFSDNAGKAKAAIHDEASMENVKSASMKIPDFPHLWG